MNMGYSGYFLIISQVVVSAVIYSDYKAFFHEESSPIKIIFGFLYACLSIISLYHLINVWFHRKRFLRSFFNIVLVLLHIANLLYMIQSNGMIDYFVVKDEIDNMFIGDEHIIQIIYSHCPPPVLFLLLFSTISVFFIDYKFGLFSGHQYNQPIKNKRIFITFFYLILLINTLPYKDGTSSYLYSILDYYLFYPKYQPQDKLNKGDFEDYPFEKNGYVHSKNLSPYSGDKPHVFLIIKESFNANVVEKKDKKNREYTPYMNRLIHKGLYVEQFYGNSIRTCNGLFAILSSLVPPIRGKVTRSYSKLNFQSLPTIFKNNGYLTVYFQAYQNLNFDSLYTSLIQDNFAEAHSVYAFMTKQDKKKIWGWGPEDKTYFKYFFQYFDTYYKNHLAKQNKPSFVVLSTINNHYPYEVPPKKRHLYKNPKNMKEKYANSIHLSDRQLQVFFSELKKRKYLKNSVIIVTSDHGHPTGEHKFVHNELAFYEESFRIPFLMLWENKIAPQRIKNQAFSQIDIAPTLVDRLQLSVARHHFQGSSIFKTFNKTRLNYLVQPYNGGYLAVVDYPFKYIKHLRTGKSFLFNLKQDHGEMNNLFSSHSKTDIDQWEKKLSYLFLNQHLIENNQIWKSE